MSIPNQAAADILELYFNNTAHAAVGDAGGLQPSAVAGSLFVSLHTADPTETGTQTSSEAAYTGYARVAVARSGAGWAVAVADPAVADNVAAIVFPICTAGSSTVTHFGVGVASAGAGQLLWSGTITSPAGGLIVNPGVTPTFAIGAADFTLD